MSKVTKPFKRLSRAAYMRLLESMKDSGRIQIEIHEDSGFPFCHDLNGITHHAYPPGDDGYCLCGDAYRSSVVHINPYPVTN